MKILKVVLLGLLSVFISCTSNNEEPTIDCSVSTLGFTTATTDASCGADNGTIEATGSGGEAPYMYSLDNGAAQASGVFENLAAGTYNVTVTDNVACSIIKQVSVVNAAGFQATGSVVDSGCETTNGEFTATPTGGVAPYAYSLSGGASQSSATFTNLSAGEYEMLITDAAGCDFSLIEKVLTGVSYASSIKPIINNSCATTGCHDGSTTQTNFTIFSNVQGSASSIKSKTQDKSMPKNSSLTQEQIDAIACWVNDGALDN